MQPDEIKAPPPRRRPTPAVETSQAPRNPPSAMDHDIYYFRGKNGEDRVQSGRVTVLKSGQKYGAHVLLPSVAGSEPQWEMIGHFEKSNVAMQEITTKHEKLRVAWEKKQSKKVKKPKT